MGTLSSPQKRATSIILKDVQESNYYCGKERGSEGLRIGKSWLLGFFKRTPG